MSLDNTLQEIGAGLISTRANERKKHAESLKNFLSGNEAPSLLSKNTIKKKGYNWNNVFDDVNEYILKELEKYETSKTFFNVTAPLCTSLLHLCLAGSNKGQAFICCEKVLEACLYILKDNRMATAIGDAYLQLLYKHILPYDHYVSFITPATWQDLLAVSIKSSLTNHSQLDSYTLLRLICSVIKKGTSCSQFVVPLRNVLPQLKRCFQKIENDKKTQETVTEITTILLEKVSSEGRLAMCEFTESILPLFLKNYDQNADQKKKSSVFKLLHLIILLHHPEGKLQGENGSLANNWTVWNKHVHSLMEITCLEANYLQKLRKHNDNLNKHCECYYLLAASVYHQILKMPSLTADDSLNSSSTKRQRVSLNNNKCFSDLIDEFKISPVPWLGVLYYYIKKYGDNVTIMEYMALLNVADILLSSNNLNCNWNTFETLTCSILNNLVNTLSYDENQALEHLVALWNSCVRNSTSSNDVHRATHNIMQTLLEMNILQYQTVQPLIKLYHEKGMPVTDSSIKTLCCIYQKHYNKCSDGQERKKCFEWFIQGNIGSMDVERVREFISSLIADKNSRLNEVTTKKSNSDVLYDTLFHSVDKCILFSIGDMDIVSEDADRPNATECLEINVEISELVKEYLQSQITRHVDMLRKREIRLGEFIQYIRVVIAYIDVTMQTSIRESQIEENELYCSLKAALKIMCQVLAKTLKENKDERDQINLLKCFQALWLTDYNPIINALVRSCVDQDLFSSINQILSVQNSKDDDVVYEENDEEYNCKHNCIWLLAAYCRKSSEYRGEILELILDPVLYDFTSSWDVECAFRCVRILIEESVEDCPLDAIFTLLSNMCKTLFRNSEATETILRILLDLLDRIWMQDGNMKQNCLIMVKGYMQRCEKLYYPPHVAALICKCVARMTELDSDHTSDLRTIFQNALLNLMRCSTHSIRLYICYLLNVIANKLTDSDREAYFSGLLEIFIVDEPDNNELFIKDESENRTLTVLHSFLALAQAKQSFVHSIVTELLKIHREKSLDTSLVKTFLNKITKTVTFTDIETYFNDNIISVINFWLSKKKKIEDLPLGVLGFHNVDNLLEKHMKWIIATDILWLYAGDVKKSNYFNAIKVKQNKSEKTVIEMCFSNIVALCLPYVVTEKYNLNYWAADDNSDFNQLLRSANKMFIATRHILDNEKWSNLFVETIAELLLMSAMNLRDQAGAEEMFHVSLPRTTDSHLYPKAIFESILRYFGELTDGNIMQYLCSYQAITIFDILYILWKNVLQEKVFEFRVMSLYTFITFVECVPVGYDSDALVAIFTCNSITHAIKGSKCKKEMRILTQALKIVLAKSLPRSDLIWTAKLKALSVLLLKKEEGFDKECEDLLKHLSIDMKALKPNEDVVDFSNASHDAVIECNSRIEFSERLKAYSFTLACPSHKSLSNLRQFVKLNKHHVYKSCEELSKKHFSEECKTSVLHQVIFALTNIMKSSSDDKIIIEACNCLAEIGTYDLKTIVTVPPPDNRRVINPPPKQSFAFTVVAVLSEVLCDENPAAINKAVAALNELFKFREGKDALELGDVNAQLLKPFLSSNADVTESAIFKLSSRKLEKCSEASFWIPKDTEDHIQWLTRVTTDLLDILVSETNYLKTLKDVCQIKPTISQRILPGLVGLLLYWSPETYIQIYGDQIDNFFSYIWKMNFDEEFDSSGSRCGGKTNVINHDRKMIIQYMIDIVNFTRLQRTHYKARPDRTPLDALNYLRLEYDKIAWAASVADQNLVAIYYGELWAVARNGGIPPPSPERTTNLEGGDNIQRIFRKCFVSIGEMDAVDGCGTAHLISENEKRKHLINTGQYADALLSHDIALSSGGFMDTDLQLGVVRSLYKSGMHHMALQYIKSLPENDQLNDVKYDCLTCLGDWSNFVDTKDLEEKSKTTMKNPSSLIKALRYACLRDCLNVQTERNLESKLTLPLDRAKLAVSRWCQNFNMQNCQNVYRVLANLHLFNDIEDYFSVRCDKVTISGFLNSWKVEKLPSFHDFKHLESLIAQRSLILEHAGKTYNSFLTDIVSLQLQYAEFGLSNGRLQMAQRLLSIAKNLQNSDAVSLVESRVSWAKGHRDIALAQIRMMDDRTDDIELKAASLRQYGMWMAESKFDNPRDIINKFLKKSLDALAGSDHKQTRLKVYYDIAKFADSEYKQVVAYMNSSIYEHKLKCMENMKGTADSMRSTSTQQQLTRDEKKYLATTRGLSNLDEAEITNTKAEKQRFLQLAMRYYLLSLKDSEDNNLSVFRVISLWLANPSLQLEEGDSFETLLHAVPSRKFVAVLPQLVPRLAQEPGPFADNLTKILKRCAIEHPHHTLPILFSLKNSDKDICILNASRHAAGDSPPSEPPAARVGAAAQLVASLAAESDTLARIIAQMELLCDATISFANYKTKEKAQKQKIPSAELIHRLGRLDAVPVPIDTIPVRHDCDYSFIPTIDSFENCFELVGGINCPKKINCRSSDGKRRIVLVKGEDDLRQDAVMQQVFNIVNTLLEKNSVTSRNKLLIRTYKVVPMSRQSGVLEWCEGTLPLGLYLIGTGTNGAHARYRPQDISCTAARAKFTTIQNKRSLSDKLAVYLSILKNFKPVFHNFFTEQFLDPVTWYERRLAYTKSVATSSMIGYILGLGDRHVQNILIDQNTAEVVHIDFGIAFDQGKALPTPETIPFRLTQDMIAGFGSSGVEGIFRKSCEKTMQVLRDNHDTLLTILEVLLCDPLYAWTTKKFTSTQKNVNLAGPTGSVADLAERALLAVGSKLHGTEGGAAGGVAVPGQVARLIQSATDPANLCRLFHGWQPYL